jgi:hypothetical protein
MMITVDEGGIPSGVTLCGMCGCRTCTKCGRCPNEVCVIGKSIVGCSGKWDVQLEIEVEPIKHVYPLWLAKGQVTQHGTAWPIGVFAGTPMSAIEAAITCAIHMNISRLAPNV